MVIWFPPQGRPATPLWRRRRLDDGLRAYVLRDKLGVLAQAEARALDLDHDRVVQQAVEKGRGHDGIAEHLAPLGKAAVRGQSTDTADLPTFGMRACFPMSKSSARRRYFFTSGHRDAESG